jgi:hypothetical protein
MIDVFADGMINSFIEGDGELTPIEACKISDCITVLSTMLQVSGDEKLFKEFKDSVENAK